MPTEVDASDWGVLDPWWDAYTQTRSATRTSSTARALDAEGMTDAWVGLDPRWRAYADTSPHVRAPATTQALAGELLADSWDELDPWWNVYTETGHETAVEIADLLQQSNEAWRQSAAPFDTDPLASPLTPDRGPFLPSIEERWSNWLAKLLRSSTALVTELFHVDVERAPDEVVREDQLSKEEGGFRRPDVLVFHAELGISIEVKLDDENYEKTAETAVLVERHYGDYEWTHALLLPKWKEKRLKTIVTPPVESQCSDQLQIEWDDPGPIPVLYWRDVTAAIRTLLRRGEAVDDQWAANAYLFCAAVEQQIMNFQSKPVIDEMADPTDVVDTIQPITVAGVLEEQLTYLDARVDP